MSLCKISSFPKVVKSLPGRMRTKHKHFKGTSLCTFLKGSYTVEAAVVLPVVAGFLTTILFFFRMLQVQDVVEKALYYAGRKTAVESSITESEAGLLLSAEYFFRQALRDAECIDDYVNNGSLGIHLLKSDFSGEDIYLRAEYSMNMPVSFFGLGKIYLWQQNSFRKWIGDKGMETGEYVYIAETGNVYHSSLECQSIHIRVMYTTLEQIQDIRGYNGQKFYACSSCIDEKNAPKTVYYTNYGRLYHGNIHCSFIKRTVKKISIEEVGERGPCSFCY